MVLRLLFDGLAHLEPSLSVGELRPPVYELTVAKQGLKLEEWTQGSCLESSSSATPAPPPTSGPNRAASRALDWILPFGCDVYFKGTDIETRLFAGKTTLGELLPVIEFAIGRTIVDKTGYTRRFNAQAVYRDPGSQDLVNGDAVSLPSIFAVLEEQLGLKLESSRGPVPVLIIDSVDRPTEN